MGGLIFYIVSTIISLYAVYVFTFRLYDDNKERILFPYIIYLFILFAAIIPVLNIILSAIFFVVTVIDDGEDFIVDSWLFKKPGEK